MVIDYEERHIRVSFCGAWISQSLNIKYNVTNIKTLSNVSFFAPFSEFLNKYIHIPFSEELLK